MATQYKVGDKFTAKAGSTGHNYVVGTVYTVATKNNDSYCGQDCNGTFGNWIASANMVPVNLTVAMLEEEKKRLSAMMMDVEAKLTFVKEHGLESFDPKEFLMYQTLSKLEECGNKMERVRLVMKLMKELS